MRVQLSSGATLELPDGMPEAEINKIVQQAEVQDQAATKVRGMSSFRKALYGAERALDEPAMGLKQMIVGLSPQEQHDLAVRRAVEKSIPGAWASRFAGDVALGGAVGGAALRGASMLPRALQAAAPYIAATATGAGLGAAQPVLGDESRAENTGMGAAFGLGGQAIGNAVGRGIEGVVKPSRHASQLPPAVRDAATLGQLADKEGLIGRMVGGIEERYASLPFVGSIVSRAREQGTDAWRDNLVDRAAPKGTVPLGETTKDKLASAYAAYQTRYARALRNQKIAPSPRFEQFVDDILTNPQSGIPLDDAARIRQDILMNYVSRFNRAQTGADGAVTPAGTMGGDVAKDFESFLSGRARQYMKSETPGSDSLGRAYSNLERAWSTSYRRQIPIPDRRAIRDLDNQYGSFKTVERAAGSSGTVDGNFSPAQLNTAVSQRTPRGRFARGEGIMAQDANAGKGIFMDRLPNSGTADRASLAALAGGLALEPVNTALTVAALPLMATKTGRNLAMGETAGQRMIQRLRGNNAARQLGAPMAIGYENALDDQSTEY